MSDEAYEDEGERDRDRDDAPPASEKQLNFVRALQRRIGVDDAEMEKLLDEVTGKAALEDLSIREASELIDELQTQARERGVDLDAQPAASEKQVKFILSLKRRAHLTEDEFTKFLEEHAGVSEAEQVGRRDASKVIDLLLGMADASKGGGGGGGRGASKAPAKKKAAPKAAPRPASPPPADEPGDGDYDDDVPF